MGKATIDLPRELEAALQRLAAAQGISKAELMREALREKRLAATTPRPRVGLLAEGLQDPTGAKRVDALLEGFGA